MNLLPKLKSNSDIGNIRIVLGRGRDGERRVLQLRDTGRKIGDERCGECAFLGHRCGQLSCVVLDVLWSEIMSHGTYKQGVCLTLI